ncbi:hypothetical protein Tco_0909777 [Tanacetum coccineum]|uniref:Uncharacterized protein n=1 Tax=Tanacetum coccineum TaxID=301880 RepID=A0ABQ5CSN8_9ASTR
MMSFFTAVVTSRYPTYHNQLRTSLKPLVNKRPSMDGKSELVSPFRGDKLLMLLEQRENTLMDQVEATQGKNGLSSVTTATGRVIFPSNAKIALMLHFPGMAQMHSCVQRKNHCTANTEGLGVRLSTSASGSQPSGNTRMDKIRANDQVVISNNKVEAHPMNVKSLVLE